MMEGDSQSWRSRRPQGKTRRHKRPNSTSATDQNKIRCTRSTIRFDVDLPNYYKDTTTRTGSDVGTIAQNNADAVKETSLPTTDTKNDASPAETKIPPQDDTNNEHSDEKKHNDFIAALERYGSSEGAWNAIASELKWTVDDVKVYAYSYFKSLVQYRKTTLYDKILAKDKDQNNEKDATCSKAEKEQPPWSSHELVLLDSLMIKYCIDLNCLDVQDHNEKDDASYWTKRRTVWEKIASQFPGKSSIACKKEGFARLLRAYDQRQQKKEETNDNEK